MAKRRGNREGTIYKRGSSWTAQVTLEGHRLTKTFATQKECQAWIREVSNQIERGLRIDGAKMRVGDYLELWLENYQGAVRPKTHHQYRGVVYNHLIPALGKIKLNTLHPQQIQSLYSKLAEQGHSQRTIQLIHSVLRRALVIAERQGLIVRNPAKVVEPPKVPFKEMQILDDNQVRQMMIAADGSRFEHLYYLAVTTGLRQGELLGLKWIDVDWASNNLHVRRQIQRVTGKGTKFSEPKTKAGRRMVELGSEALKRLSSQRKQLDIEALLSGWQDQGLIFPSTSGTPADQRNLHRDFKRVLEKAGLPNIRFHDLRHTAATLMLINGIPLIVVSRRLGHSKPSVTLDIYGHYLPGMQSTAAALMDELATPIAVKLQQTAASTSEDENPPS